MSIKEELLSFYKDDVLASTGVVVTDDGLVMAEGVGDTLIPVTVTNNEVLCLPTDERVRSGNWEGLQPFHPISENALRGESVVLKKLRVLLASRLTTVLCSAMEMLTHVAADTKLHSKLSPKASEFLDHAKKADEKTLKRLKLVLDKVSLTGDHRLLSFYFGRPGGQKKDSYTRTCRVDFPILDEFETKEPFIFGVKMRHDDKAAIKGIFNWLLDLDQDGHNDLMEQYGCGTHSLTVPYFYTLMKSYVKVAAQLNSKLKLFKKSHPDQVKELLTNVDWEDKLEDLGRYRDIIPALRGNEGTVPSHPGRRVADASVETDKQQTVAAPEIRRNIGINASVGSAPVEPPVTNNPHNLTMVDVGLPTPPVTPAPVPPQMPQTPVSAPTVPAASNNGLLSWGALNGGDNRYGQQPVGVTPYGNPVFPAVAPTIANPNARDLLRAQSYQHYQQSPNAYYNPAVHNTVMAAQPPVRFATVPVSPTPGPKLPSRW